MKKFRCSLIITAVITAWPILLKGADQQSLTILYTNSLNGNIDYCHCPTDPKGGLVKRSTEIKQIRSSHAGALLFETGDFFSPDEDPLLAEYILMSYKHIGYDALLFGDQELITFTKKTKKESASLPFICGNLKIKRDDGTVPAFKKKIMLKQGNFKIGVAATISPDVLKYVPEKTARNLIVTDQAEELKKDIAGLKAEGADIIVVLSHSGYDRDLLLADSVPGIDLIIGGHSQTLLNKPVSRGGALIVQAGTNGSRIGILKLTIKKGKIISWQNSFRLPDHISPVDDPVIRDYIQRYNIELRKNIKNNN